MRPSIEDPIGYRHEVFNLGNNQTITLIEMIGLETAVGRRAELQWLAEQPGDVPQTWANIDKAHALLGYAPATSFADGVTRFAAWREQNAAHLQETIG